MRLHLQPQNLAYSLFLLLMGAVVVAMPVAASAQTTSTTISSTISSVISLLTSSGTVSVDVTPSGSGKQTVASDTVTVSTSDINGYTLTLSETTGSTALVSGGNSIAAIAGSKASPVALTANKWGYRVDGVGGFGAGVTTSQNSDSILTTKFAPVPVSASPDTIKTTSGTASSDTTTVWYSVAADTAQAAGTYTNSVTYTAVAN